MSKYKIIYIVLALSRFHSHSHYDSVSLFPSIPFLVSLFLSPLSLPISVAPSLTLSLSSISPYLSLTDKTHVVMYIYKHVCQYMHTYISLYQCIYL